MLPVGVAVLVFGIMYLIMLERFGKVFKEHAAVARQFWTAQPAVTPPPP